MLSYNRIAYEIDTVKAPPPEDVLGISMLHHFEADYPEAWSFNGNTSLSTSSKFGKTCAYFPDTTSNVTITNTTGLFTLNPLGNYEFEVFVQLKDTTLETEANIFSIGDLTLTERPKTIADYYYETQGYKFYGGHTFKYFDAAITWTEAKTACEELGGHLATSTSAEKNTFLSELIGKTNGAFLGGTDEAVEGTWAWVTGEDWDYTNWNSKEPNNANGGEDYLAFGGDTGGWNDVVSTQTGNYICEWDYDMRGSQSLSDVDPEGVNNKILSLSSSTWGISSTSEVQMLADTWYHILLRVSDNDVSVFVDGVEVMRSYINGSATITPETVQLGGYIGYMDEFAFRRNAGTNASIVPTSPYDTNVVIETVEVPVEGTSAGNAPVSRVAWSCENLPDGLTLSSAGVLSGHPTTAGTYECDMSVTTNWGTTTKKVKIKVE